MKKLLLILIISAVYISCKQSEEAKQSPLAPLNGTGYLVSNISTDVPKRASGEEEDAPILIKKRAKAPRIVYVEEEAPAQVVKSKEASNETEATTQPSTPVSEKESSTSAKGTTDNTGAGSEEATTEVEKPQVKKKGWSNAAKGAVIGGVAGAIGGAVINKKSRGAGAVIGAVIGAAGGYAIGRSKDKKAANADPFNLEMNN